MSASFSLMPQQHLTADILPRRIAAWLVDLLIVGLLLLIAKAALLVLTVATFGLGAPLLGLLAFVPIAYTALCVASRFEATPGQALLGLRVVRAGDLGRPSTTQAIAYAVCFAFTWIAGGLWLAVALVTNGHRALHDYASGLIVVRERALAELRGATLTMSRGAWTMRANGGAYPR